MTGLGGVNPLDGVRVSLSLVESEKHRAVYAVNIRWTEAGHAHAVDGRATVTTEPLAVTFDGIEDAPESTSGFVRTLVRTTARSVQDGRWPRRVTRWRDEA